MPVTFNGAAFSGGITLQGPRIPGAPTIGTATNGGDGTVTLTFTAPVSDGDSPITSYTATSSPGSITGTLSQAGSGTITITGLTNGTAYTFTVTATNAAGTGPASAASNSATPNPPTGQQAFTTAGTFSWTAPAAVSRVAVVCVGGGGGGGTSYAPNNMGPGAGGLGWKNNITVVPGNSYTVVVGSQGYGAGFYSPFPGVNASPGEDSYFIDATTVKGQGGQASGNGGSYVGDGGGNGGNCYGFNTGAGAGGYTGAGGDGVYAQGGAATGNSGNGGGGGGGGVSNSGTYYKGGGGGVGILGQGTSGAGGVDGNQGGKGGSGGSDGGGGYAGGYGGGGTSNPQFNSSAGSGGVGAVRIIWGPNRAFPSTNTGDL